MLSKVCLWNWLKERGAGITVMIILLCVIVRALPVGYPPAYYSSDEVDAVHRAVKMGSGDLLPFHASKPTGYNLIIAGSLGARYVLKKITVGFSRQDMEREFFLTPLPLYVAARAINVIAAAVTMILLLYSLREDRWMAWLAALVVLGFGRSSVYYSHVAKEDVLAGLFVFASFAATTIALRSEERVAFRKWIMVSAAAAGFALSTKYNCFFALLFPLLGAWRNRHQFFIHAIIVLAMAGVAFILLTPFALLHPVEFVSRTLSSAVARQVAGSYNILYYGDNRYNLNNHGPIFVGRIFLRELGPAAGTALIALVVCLAERTARICALPVALYIGVLMWSGQLDYQYVVVIAPLMAWMVGKLALRLHGIRPFYAVAIVVVPLVLTAGLHGWEIARQTVEFLGGDTRTVAGQSLEQAFPKEQRHDMKPMLILSDYYYRYYPDITFQSSTFERLSTAARQKGGEGGYFAGAMKFAPADGFRADFAPLRNGYTISNGKKEFERQVIPLSLDAYRGKYSVIVVPENTFRLAEIDEPGLEPVRRFIEEVESLPLLVDFTRIPWKLAGPEIRIYQAP